MMHLETAFIDKRIRNVIILQREIHKLIRDFRILIEN